jgi:hypothetical protein
MFINVYTTVLYLRPKTEFMNVNFVGHNLEEFSDLSFLCTMFTLQTSFKPLLLGGGGGIKSVSRGDGEY